MTIDSFTKSHWYVVGRPEDMAEGTPRKTRLLGADIEIVRRGAELDVRATEQGVSRKLPSQTRYGHLWTTLSDHPRPLFEVPEFEEEGRRLVTAGCISVRCAGPRVVENFLDMAHFPFVHTGILGEESHSEVADYHVEMRADTDEVWATKCEMYQPQASASAAGGQITRYMYRVPHPAVSILYKTCPIRPEGVWDLVGLFVQPREEELCDVHSFVLVFDDENTDVDLLHFQQKIFLQDRMILENQVPRTAPLDPRSEMPTRADASSIAFRRWLKAKGVKYGVNETQPSPVH